MEEKAGPVKFVNVITFEDSKRCKGMAYVSFNDPKGAAAALAMDGEKLGDRWLSINLAEVKSEKRKSGPESSGRACFRCGKRGHNPKNCESKRVCYRCKSTEHMSSACPQKKS